MSSFIILILLVILLGLGMFVLWKQYSAYSLRKRYQHRREIPYILGNPIQDPKHFFGRERLLRLLCDTIAIKSYALVGEFRIGKTSVQFQLKHMFETLDDPRYVFLPVFIDLQEFSSPEHTFSHFLGSHVMQYAQRHGVPEAILSTLAYTDVESPDAYDFIDFQYDVDLLLDHWSNEFEPRQPLLILQIDEVSLVADFDNDTLVRFRSIVIHQPMVKVVLSGRFIPRDQDSFALSPWWNFFVEIEVFPMTFPEAQELIESPVRGVFTFDGDAIETIHAYSQGRPFQMQTLCSDILQYKYDSAGRVKKRITVEDVRAVRNQRDTAEASRLDGGTR